MIIVPFGSNSGPWCYSEPTFSSQLPCLITPSNCTMSNIYTVTCAGCYTIRVADIKGCYKDTTRCIIPTPSINIVVDSIIHTDCFNTCSRLQIRRTGGSLAYSAPYSALAYPTVGAPIAPSSTTGPTSNPVWRWNCLAPGTYTILVKDNKKCWDTVVVTIQITTPPSPPIIVFSQPTYSIGDTLIAALIYPSPTGLTYSWAGPNLVNYSQPNLVIPNLNITYNGIYTITVSNGSNCSSTTTFSLMLVPPVLVSAKAFLSGAYNTTTLLMNDNLRISNYIPLSNPYNSAPYNTMFTYIPSTATTTSAILSTSGANAIVDWVILELRNKSNPALVVDAKPALIQRDGDIVNPVDGISAVRFYVSPDSFYLSIVHRNHLGVMTRNPLPFNTISPLVDFTSFTQPLYRRLSPQNNNFVYTSTQDSCTRQLGVGMSTVRALYGGNANIIAVGSPLPNKSVRYNGINNDKQQILIVLSSSTGVLLGYHKEDINMNGEVKANGLNNDKLILLQNIGLNINNIIYAQLPY